MNMKKASGILLFMLVYCYMAYSQPASGADTLPFFCQREFHAADNVQVMVYDMSNMGCVGVV